jgi:hypothetical protein
VTESPAKISQKLENLDKFSVAGRWSLVVRGQLTDDENQDNDMPEQGGY